MLLCRGVKISLAGELEQPLGLVLCKAVKWCDLPDALAWQRRNPGQWSISARECCSSFPLQEAVCPCLVRGCKAKTLFCLKNLPKVMSLSLDKPFLHCDLSLRVCFAPVWKQSTDDGDPAWALSLHLPSPAMALVLCAFVTSLGQQACELQALICSFLALEVS